jgi:hypothetical protein
MSSGSRSEWWRNPDGWLLTLCHLTALGGKSDTWVVAVLRPTTLDPDLTERDWKLHHLAKHKRFDRAQDALQVQIQRHGGAVKVESPAVSGTMSSALTRPSWWHRLIARLLDWARSLR